MKGRRRLFLVNKNLKSLLYIFEWKNVTCNEEFIEWV